MDVEVPSKSPLGDIGTYKAILGSMEHGWRMIYAGFPSFFGFGVGGRPCCNCFQVYGTSGSKQLSMRGVRVWYMGFLRDTKWTD